MTSESCFCGRKLVEISPNMNDVGMGCPVHGFNYKPKASIRLWFVSDREPVCLHFETSDAYNIQLVEKLKEAGWKEAK